MTALSTDIENLAVDTIRALSMDGVQTANSGHPGTPMALAPIAYQVFNHAMNYDPDQPNWPGRDRFVLSCGHASMLLYSTLHLAGVKATDESGNPTKDLAIPLEDIKNFRQIGSVCAGHPEYGEAAGIETTTGPLGAGVSNSVGMAMAQKWLAENYNTADAKLFDYNIYTICSDGDLMEGISTEAASVAGHLGLDNLVWFYDDNNITIEGNTDLAFSEDVGTKFKGLGWNVVHVDDANDRAALQKAVDSFHACNDKPTIVIVKSIIGYGAPNKQNTHGAHGAPLGWDEVELAKKTLRFAAGRKVLRCRRRSRAFSQRIWELAVRKPMPLGRRLGKSISPIILKKPPNCSVFSRVNCQQAGTRTFLFLKPAKKATPPATVAVKSLTRSLKISLS